MKNIFEKIRLHRMKFVLLVIGAIVGYAYWYFWGCDGSCPIKSVWYKMAAYGGFMGWVVGGFFPLATPKNTEETV